MFFNRFKEARANITGGKVFPKINGTVTFKEVSNGIILTAKIHGLPKSNSNCKR